VIEPDPTEGRGTPKFLDAGKRSESLLEESGQVLGRVTIEVNGEAGVYLDSRNWKRVMGVA
jgi:hypothetical protein